ncbi:MAG: DM13 domain-containing protein [Pseudomonadota bacterium]
MKIRYAVFAAGFAAACSGPTEAPGAEADTDIAEAPTEDLAPEHDAEPAPVTPVEVVALDDVNETGATLAEAASAEIVEDATEAVSEVAEVPEAGAASIGDDMVEIAEAATETAQETVEATVEQVADTVEAAAPTRPVTLHSGSWTRKSQRSRGTWSIVEANGVLTVVLDDEFQTRSAPDLKIFLSPLSAADANGDNATNGSRLVAELSSNRGAQSYTIPDGTDLSSFSSVLIHCEQFSKLWSAADL